MSGTKRGSFTHCGDNAACKGFSGVPKRDNEFQAFLNRP